jgi:hypothetical protein
MNDNIENWLCDATMIIEKSMGQVRFECIEGFVESVTERVSQQVKDILLWDNQGFVALAVTNPVGADLMDVAFSHSRLAAEINA